MLSITRKGLAGISSVFTIALVLVLGPTALATGPVVHNVTAGGPDACTFFGFPHPGCDGNFSLVANEYADGSVSGQYTDRFARGDGFHAVVDCLSVAGDDAWVSGVITSGIFTDPDTGEEFDLTGLPVATRIRDNGSSSNDPADQISFSWIGDPTPCTDQFDYDMFDAPEGQVRVR